MVKPQRFQLVRDVDHSGSSGTGIVAHGVQFLDGICVMRWLTENTSTAIYGSLEQLIAIHGHGGDSYIDWIDR